MQGTSTSRQSRTRTPLTAPNWYSIYLLYSYQSTDTDAEAGLQAEESEATMKIVAQLLKCDDEVC
jgi:hypothetical protein